MITIENHPLPPAAARTPGGQHRGVRGWRGAESERPVSDRSADLVAASPGKFLESSANGGFQIADRTLLERPRSAVVRRKQSSAVPGPNHYATSA
jgi:hypothetical protein